MKRILSIVCLALLTTGLWAQQTESEKPETKTYNGRVVDAETGETLPFSAIYFSKTSGTKTDSRGEFSIESSPDSTLVFSCVGYERLPVKASELQKEVRLTPMTTMMREVAVVTPSGQSILRNMGELMAWEYKQWKYEIGNFEIAAVLTDKDGETKCQTRGDIQCAGNLRRYQFRGGNQRGYFPELPGEMDLVFNYKTHICDLMGLGSRIEDSEFWQSAITPLDNPDCYAASVERLRGKEGQQIYVVNVKPKDTDSLRQKAILTGTLYVDALSQRLLRFNGKVQNLQFQSLPTELKFHIDYRHTNGFTEVEQVLLEGENTKNSFCMELNNRYLHRKALTEVVSGTISVNNDEHSATGTVGAGTNVKSFGILSEEEHKALEDERKKWARHAGKTNIKRFQQNVEMFRSLWEKSKM